MAFIFGILSSFFAFVLQGLAWIFHPELFTFSTPLTPAMFISLLFLALTEEGSRVLFSKQHLKNSPRNTFFFPALLFGIGFALLEVVLTYWNGFSWAVFGASSFHIGATFLTFWWLRESAQKGSVVTLVTLLTLLHACFNLSVLYFR